jgi:hypothetical protein
MALPLELRETLKWLIRREQLQTAGQLARVLAQFAPSDDKDAALELAQILSLAYSFDEAAALAQPLMNEFQSEPLKVLSAATCLLPAGRADLLIPILEELIQKLPENVDAGFLLAKSLKATGQLASSFKLLRSLCERISSSNKFHKPIKLYLLEERIRNGDLGPALWEYLALARELRWIGRAHEFPWPRLEPGTDLRGKRVLIAGEGGYGDEMINVRFAKTIRDRGGIASWYTRRSDLAGLLRSHSGLDSVLDSDSIKSVQFDAWVPAIDLPRVLQLPLGQIASAPYLFAKLEKAEKWKKQLGQDSKLNVGIRWQTHAGGPNDYARVLSFAELELVTDLEGVSFYSLHQGDGMDQLPENSAVADWGRMFRSWEDTAGAIAALDLVITSDTAIAHLAGALGKPTWMLCPIECSYLWMPPGDQSIWYKNFKLFRQKKFRSWTAELDEIKEDLPRFSPEASGA